MNTIQIKFDTTEMHGDPIEKQLSTVALCFFISDRGEIELTSNSLTRLAGEVKAMIRYGRRKGKV